MARDKPIDKLTLKDMMFNYELYSGLPEGLSQLPLPEKILIGKHYYDVPQSVDKFMDNICYGQRLFFVRDEDNDFGVIIRLIDSYYYTIVTGKKWDGDQALLFGSTVINCLAKELYPVAMHLTLLISQMAEREKSLLCREPSRVELAAGIEKLNVFAELNALDFLRDAMKITIEEVLLTPYKECLVRFMIAKETMEYQERYMELIKQVHEPNKYKNEKMLRT